MVCFRSSDACIGCIDSVNKVSIGKKKIHMHSINFYSKFIPSCRLEKRYQNSNTYPI